MVKSFLRRLLRVIQHPGFSLAAGVGIFVWLFLHFDIDLKVLLLPRDPLLQVVVLLLLPNILLSFSCWGLLTSQRRAS